MASHIEQDLLERIGDVIYEGCLRASVADSLDPDWRKHILEPHRQKPISNTTVSGMKVRYWQDAGWLTLLRQNGEHSIICWAPELTRKIDLVRGEENLARVAIVIIQTAIAAVIPLQRIQPRGKTPFEWLALKGMSHRDIAAIRR